MVSESSVKSRVKLFESASGSVSEGSASPTKTSRPMKTVKSNLLPSPYLNESRLQENDNSSIHQAAASVSVDTSWTSNKALSSPRSTPVRYGTLLDSPRFSPLKETLQAKNGAKSKDPDSSFSLSSRTRTSPKLIQRFSPVQAEVNLQVQKCLTPTFPFNEKRNMIDSCASPSQRGRSPLLHERETGDIGGRSPNRSTHILHNVQRSNEEIQVAKTTKWSSPSAVSPKDLKTWKPRNEFESSVSHNKPNSSGFGSGTKRDDSSSVVAGHRSSHGVVTANSPLFSSGRKCSPTGSLSHVPGRMSLTEVVASPPSALQEGSGKGKHEHDFQRTLLDNKSNVSLRRYSRLHSRMDPSEVRNKSTTYQRPPVVEEERNDGDSQSSVSRTIANPNNGTSDRTHAPAEAQEDGPPIHRRSPLRHLVRQPDVGLRSRSRSRSRSRETYSIESRNTADNLDATRPITPIDRETMSDSSANKLPDIIFQRCESIETKPNHSPMATGAQLHVRGLRHRSDSSINKGNQDSGSTTIGKHDEGKSRTFISEELPNHGYPIPRHGDTTNAADLQHRTVADSASSHVTALVAFSSREGTGLNNSDRNTSRVKIVRSSSPALLRGAADFNSFLYNGNEVRKNLKSHLGAQSTKISGLNRSDHSASERTNSAIKEDRNINLPNKKDGHTTDNPAPQTLPLQHMLTVQRTRKFGPRPQETGEPEREHSKIYSGLNRSRDSSPSTDKPASKPKETTSYLAYSYGSAQRLSNRLTRAERFNSLKKTREIRGKVHDDESSFVSSIAGDECSIKQKDQVHPIFGYCSKAIDGKNDNSSVDENVSALSNPTQATSSDGQEIKGIDQIAGSSPARRQQHLKHSTESLDASSQVQGLDGDHVEDAISSKNSSFDCNLKKSRPQTNLFVKSKIQVSPGLRSRSSSSEHLRRIKNPSSSVSFESVSQSSKVDPLRGDAKLQTKDDLNPNDNLSPSNRSPVLNDNSLADAKHSNAIIYSEEVENHGNIDRLKNKTKYLEREKRRQNPLALESFDRKADLNDDGPLEAMSEREYSQCQRHGSPEGAKTSILEFREAAGERKYYRGSESNFDGGKLQNVTGSEDDNRHQQKDAIGLDMPYGMIDVPPTDQPGLNADSGYMNQTTEVSRAPERVYDDLQFEGIAERNERKKLVDDDDDIFFGLEEDTVQSIAVPIKTTKDQLDENVDDTAAAHSSYLESSQRIPTNDPTMTHKMSVHEKELGQSLNDAALNQQGRSLVYTSDAENDMPNSASSDVASSIRAGNLRKQSRFRPNAVDTIAEETAEDARNVAENLIASQDCRDEDEASIDESRVVGEIDTVVLSHEDSLRDPQPVARSLFLNFGCALVNSLQSSFQNACHVSVPAAPTNNFHSDLAPSCGPSIPDQCTLKGASSIVGGETEDDTSFVDDETKASFGQLFIDQTATSTNENEAQAWADRFSEEKGKVTKEDVFLDDPLVKDESATASAIENAKQLEIRRLAKQQLSEHVRNALTIHGSLKGSIQRPELSSQRADSRSQSSESEETRPKSLDTATPALLPTIAPNSLLAPLSYDPQDVLERFISTLKNEGIEVLKLGRRNGWQIRFLTVSREVSWPNRDQSSTDSTHCPQCPRALLWLKQFSSENYSIDAIKGKGRGGVLFTQLLSVDFPRTDLFLKKTLPRKFQPNFPPSGGVVLTYVYEGGTRELLLCFRNNVDAQSFCTSMKIIKKVVDRWMDAEQASESKVATVLGDVAVSRSA